MSNFSSKLSLFLELNITSQALYLMAYSDHSHWLYGRICQLKEIGNLSYKKIAKKLTEEGIRSARNCELMAEHVFSAYKKGKAREARLNSKAIVNLVKVQFI